MPKEVCVIKRNKKIITGLLTISQDSARLKLVLEQKIVKHGYF